MYLCLLMIPRFTLPLTILTPHLQYKKILTPVPHGSQYGNYLFNISKCKLLHLGQFNPYKMVINVSSEKEWAQYREPVVFHLAHLSNPKVNHLPRPTPLKNSLIQLNKLPLKSYACNFRSTLS